jgi:hypothetical protein
MLRIAHCLDNRLCGGKFVSPTHRPRSTPQKHYLFLFLVLSSRGSLPVKALGYKPEGHGFESRWGEI